MIPLGMWKHFLAHDPLCREAEAVVIGSSRVHEIDATVVGTSVCNLYVDGLSAPGFAHLAQELSPMAPGQHRVAYVGLDHFGLWADIHPFNRVELQLLSAARPLWQVWAGIKALDFFTISDLLEAWRRYRHGYDPDDAWYYADGHVFYPRHYAQKRAGIHHSFSQQEVEHDVEALFHQGWVRASHLRALETGVHLLHAKGYAVRLFWNPVSPAHIAAARHLVPVLFQQVIDAVDRVASTLPLDCYRSASQTLDASQFGCTEHDYLDTTHVDVDCMHRIFAGAFGAPHM
jgi:hypothetical protein